MSDEEPTFLVRFRAGTVITPFPLYSIWAGRWEGDTRFAPTPHSLYYSPMSSFFLDLKDRTRVIDFLAEVLPYLPQDNLVRTRAEAVLSEVANGKNVSKEALADLAKTVGRATYVPRIAVRRYVADGDGAEEEWRRVAAAVRGSTRHLLERFKASVGGTSLEGILAHEESDTALREEERLEIDEVRRHVLPSIWIEKGGEMKEIAKDIERGLEAIEKHLADLRRIAFDEPSAPQDEIVLKIELIEDRLFFAGEEVPPEKIAQEVKAYQEQVALPVEE